MPVIGFLSSLAPGESAKVSPRFARGCAKPDSRRTERSIAFRWAEGHYDRLPALAADLVSLRVAALFAAGGLLGARGQGGDLDDSNRLLGGQRSDLPGLVASLNRPGGNITGMSMFASALGEKLPATERINTHSYRCCLSREPNQSERRDCN